MSMIYGATTIGNPEIPANHLRRLEELMNWPGSIHQAVNYGNFAGGFFYDPRLPFKPTDFYWVDQYKELMVLMSGVIFNRIEIIERLSLTSSIISEPELVLAAFNEWGEAFVKELNGDFAIFVYQKNNNKSFLYRDHLGVRPIAYSKINNTTWFSSDGIVLCKALYGEEEIDQQFMLNYLIRHGLQSTNLLESFLLLPNKKAHSIFPGHYIQLTSSGIFDKKYWTPEDIPEDNQLDFETMIREIKSLLDDAVKIRCDNRFVAAAHVSGGLDSCIVASLAKKEFKGQDEFLGFCWSPSGQVNGTFKYDERILVNKLGELTGIKTIFTNIDANDYINFLADWRNGGDLFTEDKVIKSGLINKTTLIFSGWGGDEFISIDSMGIDSDLVFKFQWRSFFRKNSFFRPKHWIGSILLNVILPALSLRYYSTKKPWSFYSKYLTDKFKPKAKTINDLYHWQSRRDIHLRFLNYKHIADRFEHCSNHGFRNGIEYRYPLVDKRIIEFMFKVPSRLLFKNGYYRILLREISEGLVPEEIRWNVSKQDPVRFQTLTELFDNVCIQVMDEVDDFKTNPELNFINFDLLKKDIADFRKGLITQRPSEAFEILMFLKKAAEFTKGYCN